MANLVEMDEQVGIFAQMDENVGPIILINKFSVGPEDFDEFLKAWAAEAEKFKQQPGFISTQLHKGIGGSGTFVNYAVWESAAHFKRAGSYWCPRSRRRLCHTCWIINKNSINSVYNRNDRGSPSD
jgi:hypothetical protein